MIEVPDDSHAMNIEVLKSWDIGGKVKFNWCGAFDSTEYLDN